MSEPQPLRLRITTRSGGVRVRARAGGEFVVNDHAVTPDPDGWLAVSTRSGRETIEVGCPAGTDLTVGASSGGIELSGPLGLVSIVSSSGSIRVDEVNAADIRTRSAKVRVRICHGALRVVSASGHVGIGEAGQVDIATESASIEVGLAVGGVLRTVNGSVRIGLNGNVGLVVRSMSGSVDVSVPADMRPTSALRTKSGRITNACPDGADAAIEVHTVSGSIRVQSR